MYVCGYSSSEQPGLTHWLNTTCQQIRALHCAHRKAKPTSEYLIHVCICSLLLCVSITHIFCCLPFRCWWNRGFGGLSSPWGFQAGPHSSVSKPFPFFPFLLLPVCTIYIRDVPINWFQTRSESGITFRSGLSYIYVCVYISSLFLNTSIVEQ